MRDDVESARSGSKDAHGEVGMENLISNLVRRYEFGTVGLPAYLVMGALLVSSVAQAQSANSPTFHINSQRLQGTLVKLSEFGRNPEGGVTRLGFSESRFGCTAIRRRFDEASGT